jgi:DNA polymerase-4
MDCFYAAIEMRDNPSLADKPIAVGSTSVKRGVLCTCNYLAREYGVHSAMPTSQALRLCPDLILLPVNMPKYVAVSQEIRAIFQQYTDIIEPLSLDEAYLDVTDCQAFNNSATLIAKAIRQDIFQQLQLTASAGIAPNKFLAKIASDWQKPNGQFVITPDKIENFVKALPVKKIFGVGKVTAKKLHELNIHTCADLQQLSRETLGKRFGKFGQQLYSLARGIDQRVVNPHRLRKSVSVERTYINDLHSLAEIIEQLPKLEQDLQKRTQKYKTRIKSLFVKLKFFDFKATTVEQACGELSTELFLELLNTGWQRRQQPVRLIGIGVHLENEEQPLQTRLF